MRRGVHALMRLRSRQLERWCHGSHLEGRFDAKWRRTDRAVLLLVTRCSLDAGCCSLDAAGVSLSDKDGRVLIEG